MRTKELRDMLLTARMPGRVGLPVMRTHHDGRHQVEFVSHENGTQRITITRRDSKPDPEIVAALLAAWPEPIPSDAPRVERTQGKLYNLTITWARVLSAENETV